MTIDAAPRPRLGTGLTLLGAMVLVMWGLEFVDQSTGNALDPLGITPRDPDSLDNILYAPWLHFGWLHLVNNSLPLLVLGALSYLAGFLRWLGATIASIVASGGLVWLVAPPGTLTAGASGLVFGYLVFLLVRGFVNRRIAQILLAVVVFVFYGGILLGILPGAEGVSWQGHLGGALGGGAAAWWQRPRRPALRY